MTSAQSVPGIRSVQPDGLLQRPEEQLRRLILLSRARAVHRIVVAGPSGLEMLGLLCRAGFEQVSCIPSTIAGGDACDVLLAVGFHDTDALCACLRRTAGHLSEGGVIACELLGLDDDRQVSASLEAIGLEVASTVFDLRDKTMVRHTVAHPEGLRRAA